MLRHGMQPCDSLLVVLHLLLVGGLKKEMSIKLIATMRDPKYDNKVVVTPSVELQLMVAYKSDQLAAALKPIVGWSPRTTSFGDTHEAALGCVPTDPRRAECLPRAPRPAPRAPRPAPRAPRRAHAARCWPLPLLTRPAHALGLPQPPRAFLSSSSFIAPAYWFSAFACDGGLVILRNRRSRITFTSAVAGQLNPLEAKLKEASISVSNLSKQDSRTGSAYRQLTITGSVEARKLHKWWVGAVGPGGGQGRARLRDR
jgi:hypothetical protein